MEYKISNHCIEQIDQRGISKDDIHRVLDNPDMILKQDVLRIFVNINRHPNLVVTAYKTSKISKYYEDKI